VENALVVVLWFGLSMVLTAKGDDFEPSDTSELMPPTPTHESSDGDNGSIDSLRSKLIKNIGDVLQKNTSAYSVVENLNGKELSSLASKQLPDETKAKVKSLTDDQRQKISALYKDFDSDVKKLSDGDSSVDPAVQFQRAVIEAKQSLKPDDGSTEIQTIKILTLPAAKLCRTRTRRRKMKSIKRKTTLPRSFIKCANWS
jgi:hypothetical protein